MGKSDQLYSAEELQGLSDEDRKALDALILHHLQTSPEILNIIRENPKTREVLKEKLGPFFNRLKG